MIDSLGHIIHIDFGFCLTNTPGNFGFETAPFKFTKDYIDIIGGVECPMFFYFKSLLYKSLDALRKHVERIWTILEIMKEADLPCFQKFNT